MKGTENIIAHIRAEAQAQADEIKAAAQVRCAEIRADYENKAKDAYAEKIRAGVRECEDRAESISKIAGMESRKGTLALKQEMVSRCFDRAYELLADLPEDRYVALFARLAAESSVTGEEELVFNARDKETVAGKIVSAANAALAAEGRNAGLTLADATGDFKGGFILSRGNITVNCTVEVLVDMCRSDMASSLADVLFE